MNDKDSFILKVIDIVVDCCASQIDYSGNMSLTKEQVLGNCKSENVVMTRAILVSMMIYEGYTVTTIASVLHKTTQAVRHLMELDASLMKSSRAYRLASAEALIRCKNL